MMTKDEIKKGLEFCKANWCVMCPYCNCIGCEGFLKQDALNLITEQEKEIERLKAQNEELTKVVSSKVYDLIDNTKEIADAREAWEQQAKIDVLKELKEKCKFDGHTVAVYKNDIDEMIAEVLNAEDKS